MRYEEKECMNVPVMPEPKTITQEIGRTNDILRDVNEIAEIILSKFHGKMQENKATQITCLQELVSDTKDKARSAFDKIREINELI